MRNNSTNLRPAEREILHSLEKGLAVQQPQLIRTAVSRIDEVVFGEVSPTFFGRIIDLIDTSDFANAPGTDHFLYAFIGHWEELQTEDRSRLLESIEKAFPNMHDQMGCVFAAELLGRHYCNEESVSVFERLRQRSHERQRACIPHGLRLLVGECPDATVAARARRLLLAMQTDDCPDVRAEVADALAALDR